MLAVKLDLWLAEIARLTFVNICVQFLAFEGVTRLSARVVLENIFLVCKERSAGQFAIEKFSFLSYEILSVVC